MPQSNSESSVGLQSMTKEWRVQEQHIQSIPTNCSLSCSRGGPSHKGCTYDWLDHNLWPIYNCHYLANPTLTRCTTTMSPCTQLCQEWGHY